MPHDWIQFKVTPTGEEIGFNPLAVLSVRGAYKMGKPEATIIEAAMGREHIIEAPFQEVLDRFNQTELPFHWAEFEGAFDGLPIALNPLKCTGVRPAGDDTSVVEYGWGRERAVRGTFLDSYTKLRESTATSMLSALA